MKSDGEPHQWTKKLFSAPNVVLYLLCILYFSVYVDRVNLGTAASLMRQEFCISNAQMGVVFSAFAYPYVIFQIFGGWLSDKFGARRVLAVCIAITSLATLGTSVVSGLSGLFLCRLLLGVGESVTFPSATRAMQVWIPSDRYGFAQGLTHSFSRLGNAVTPPVVAALIFLWGWRGSFAIMGGVTLVWVAFWLGLYRDDPRDHPKITQADLIGLPPRTPRASRPVPWKRLILRMVPVTFTYFCYGWSAWVYLNWLPSFFLEGQGFDLKKSAIFASGVFFAGVVGDTTGGVMSDIIKRRTGNVKLARLSVLMLGMFGSASCLTTVLFIQDIVTVSAALAAGFFFLEMVIAPAWAIPMDIAPQYAGTASGMMNVGFAVAGVLSPITFGFVVDLTGNWYFPFIASIGLLLAGIISSLWMHPERPFQDERPDPGPSQSAPLSEEIGVPAEPH